MKAKKGLRHPPSRGPRAAFEPRGLRRDAASTVFNLTDYRVIAALDLPHAGRRGRDVDAEDLPVPVC